MPIVTGTGKLVARASTEAQGFLFNESGVLKPSPTGQAMIGLLPQYMQDGPVVRAIQEGIALEFERVKNSRLDLLNQLFIDSATWGLKYWEELAGIAVQEDLPDNYPVRRALIKAAIAGRRFESEFWFKKRLEDVLGSVYIKDLDPETHPYRIEIESVAQIVEEPPTTHVTASVEPTAGNLNGQYTYRTTYVFSTGETSFDQGQVKDNEIQRLEATTVPTGGTFRLIFDNMNPPNTPPNPLASDPIPYNATAQQVQDALNAIPTLAGYNPTVVRATGGGLDGAPIDIEFVHERGGQPQVILAVDTTDLTGGTLTVTSVQVGGTVYENSESNTVVPVNQQVLVDNVPVSPSGAIARRIYRKKNPSMDYYLVAEIPDNETTYFYDDVSDAQVATMDTPLPFENTAANTLGIAARDLIAKTKPAHIHVELTSEFFRASINSAGDRV